MGSLRVGNDWATSLAILLSCIGEGNGNPLQCSCLENPRDRGARWAAVYGVAQSQTRLKRLSSSSSSGLLRWLSGKESTCQSRRLRRCGFNLEDPLEEEMATHSGILAWKIPWTEEPGRLQYMVSQRVGHDWAHIHVLIYIILLVGILLASFKNCLNECQSYSSWNQLKGQLDQGQPEDPMKNYALFQAWVPKLSYYPSASIFWI